MTLRPSMSNTSPNPRNKPLEGSPMLFALIRKEIINNVLSFRFMVTLVLFFGLILVSILFLTSDYQIRLRTHEASKAAHRAQIVAFKGAEDQDEQFHEMLVGSGVYGDRTPQPLGIFVQGLDDDLPAQININLKKSRSVDENFYRNPMFSLFSTPDYGYIVNIVVSLLSLLFVFDSICGEKERGTLKLLLANSIPRDLVLLSKWIGGYLSLAVPFLIALLAGIKPEEICDWYLAVYADAYDWVELPNVLGMVMHADGGYLGSKPYAASGKYINRMSDHCRHCHYNVNRSTEDDACPFNALYWHFIDRHRDDFANNPRMGMMYRNWDRQKPAQRAALLKRGDALLRDIEKL